MGYQCRRRTSIANWLQGLEDQFSAQGHLETGSAASENKIHQIWDLISLPQVGLF